MPKYNCKACGSVFVSYNQRPTYCSRKCKDTSNRADIDENTATNMYQSGMSQVEVAAVLGTTQKVIFNTLKRNGIKSRVAAKRNQFAENNHMWKGGNATYEAFHARVENRRGRPKKCSICGASDKNKWYDWANLTGDYPNPLDYARMCRSCHRAYDAARKGGDAQCLSNTN